ncbi:MAG: ATP-binding protein [Bacilli bacterium]
MFGKIVYIGDSEAHVENLQKEAAADLMNLNVIFEEQDQRILGEVFELGSEIVKIRFLGEYINNKYVNGVLRKPLLTSKIRMINKDELMELVGTYDASSFVLGESAIYKGFQICPNINNLFSNHLAIFGNSGSGKSCGVARIIQNIFDSKYNIQYNANLFIFDSFGEYKNAFGKLNELNPNYCYKFITTNVTEQGDIPLSIPVNLLKLDDFALLLQASNHAQLPIIEHTIKLAKIFSTHSEEANAYKNHLIAKALLAVLFSNETVASKKNEIFTIIEVCNTPEFNFDSVIPGLGYTRTFSECFEIDSNGNFGESVLITNYILGKINDELDTIKEPENASYSLKDFASALEFTLISEGFQHNQNLHDDAVILKVRLNSIINSKLSNFFSSEYMPLGNYISSLVANGAKKAQIININLEDVDDIYAKVFVKIISRMIFDFSKGRTDRAKIPFHLFLEEAHRYIQKDNDTFLLGYNIFDRIAKEGRKYGVILDIISQRPVEISDTVIAQCNNFLIFKMTHPLDIKYIGEMLPNISADILDKQKVLQPGNCVCFGGAFKIPMIVKMQMPNPMPYSSNCDVSACWKMPTQSVNDVKESPVNDTVVQNINVTPMGAN